MEKEAQSKLINTDKMPSKNGDADPNIYSLRESPEINKNDD